MTKIHKPGVLAHMTKLTKQNILPKITEIMKPGNPPQMTMDIDDIRWRLIDRRQNRPQNNRCQDDVCQQTTFFIKRLDIYVELLCIHDPYIANCLIG